MRRGGSRYKLPGSGGPEGGPGTWAQLCCIYLCLSQWYHCRLYKLTLSDQAQVALQQAVNFSPLLGASPKKFSPGPKPALGGPAYEYFIKV